MEGEANSVKPSALFAFTPTIFPFRSIVNWMPLVWYKILIPARLAESNCLSERPLPPPTASTINQHQNLKMPSFLKA